MSPEELDGIKAIARLLPESQTRNHIFLLLAHIDTQAAQIEALKEMLIKKQAVLNGWTHEAGFEYDVAMMDEDEFTPAILEYARQQLAITETEIRILKDCAGV